MRRELLFIGILFFAFGCASGGGVEVRKVAFVLPQGWSKAETDDKEITLGVPNGWRAGANTFMGTANVFDTGSTNDPSTPPLSAEDKKMMDQVNSSMGEMVKEDELKNLDALRKKGIILQVLSTGKATVGEELTRYYVKKKSQSSNWTWPDSDGSEQDCFPTKQTATNVKLPIGLAHRMQLTWQMNTGQNHTQISYLIPSGRDLYILRFLTDEPAETITSIEKEVAETLRIN